MNWLKTFLNSTLKDPDRGYKSQFCLLVVVMNVSHNEGLWPRHFELSSDKQ